MQVGVLCCDGCGAPVALGPGDRVRCPYCGQSVEIPAEHRALRDATRADETARRRAERAYRTLGRPPHILLQLWSQMAPSLAMISVFLLLPVGAAVTIFAMDRVGRLLDVNFYDVLTAHEQILLLWVTSLSLFALGLVLDGLGRRRAIERRALQAALSARPPKVPGGPSLCRTCAAPLEIAPGALGARCIYCGSDNLVSMPAAWVSGVASSARALYGHVKAAIDAHRTERRRYLGGLALRFGCFAALVALLFKFILPWPLVREKQNEPHDFRRAIAGPREMFDIPYYGYASEHNPLPDPMRLKPCTPESVAKSIVTPGEMLSYPQVSFGYFLPLEHGETIRLVTAGAHRATVGFHQHVKDRPWSASYSELSWWGTPVAEVPLSAAAPASFTAPVSAWYRVVVTLPDLENPRAFRFCVELAGMGVPGSTGSS